MSTRYWWMSFVDDGRPEGQKFLGACIVEALNPEGAVTAAWAADCNPGGEVGMVSFKEGSAEAKAILDLYPVGSLISEAQLRANGERSLGERGLVE